MPDPLDRYATPHHGVHVCGISADEENFITVFRADTRTALQARTMYDAVKAECAMSDDEEQDLVVDLCMDGSTEEDFPMRRQQLDRLKVVCASMETTASWSYE